MKRCGMASVVLFLVAAVLMNAATRNNTVRIRVLETDTQSVSSANAVPQNCDGVNFDAYCRAGQTVEMKNTLVVQEGDGTPFRITCTVESKWSRCVPLHKDETFTARREKRGYLVSYTDDAGKMRNQLYVFADEPSEFIANTKRSEPVPAPAENAGSDVDAAESSSRVTTATVKCSLTSTPAGADVILDGRYVGSTPSVVGVTPGSHVVVLEMAGFEEWKRDLAVTSESDLTVNAMLKKAR
jgi:hypothetical protein